MQYSENIMQLVKYLCAIILCLSLTSCEDKETQRNVSENNTLVMGVTADYPPFEFIKDKKIVGFDIDLAHEIAKKLHYKIYIKDMDFDALIPALHAGRVDFVMSGMTKTPEREKSIDFSLPYYTPTFAIVYRKEHPLQSVQDFANKIIAVQLGSTMENFLKEELAKTPMDIITLTRTPTMIQELKVGRVDGVLIEESQAKQFLKKYSELDYSLIQETEDGVAAAFPKGSKLKAQFNEALIKLRDSGKLDELKKKWHL